jgi:HEAT repeat protein
MTSGQETARQDLRGIEKVRGIFACLSKYIHAKTIYASNNPNVANFAAAFYESFESYFRDDKELVLSVEQYRMRWHEETVYENREKAESIAFLLYKDGVGEITFQSSVAPAELERFVDLLRNEIFNPSSHLDFVSRLWQAEFAGITYRVFDECAEGASGEGRGAGSDSLEQPLQAGDHSLAPLAASSDGAGSASGGPPDSLGAYLEDLVERELRHSSPREREKRLQDMLTYLFASGADDLTSWSDNYARLDDGNKLLGLLSVMLDFAELRSAPPVVRDIDDIIDRLVRFIVEEAHVPTLVALLDIQRTTCRNRPFAVDFQSLPSRIEHELTNSAFLLSLGKTKGRSAQDAQEVLGYFRLIGENAAPGVCELLATSKDASIHKDACDTLIDIADKEVPRIVNDFNMDNPYEAKDAVYLLQRSATKEVHPVTRKLMSSTDLHVREQVVEYLVGVGNDEAASLLCTYLVDGDPGIRAKTFAAVEDFHHPQVTAKVLEACFTDENAPRSPDELERMFRAAGKLGGRGALGSIRKMLGKGSWLRLGKGRGKQNKLLAITALRYIPGPEAMELLKEFAEDGDSLVRTKAQYALKHSVHPADSRPDDLTTVASKDQTP